MNYARLRLFPATSTPPPEPRIPGADDADYESAKLALEIQEANPAVCHNIIFLDIDSHERQLIVSL
ncbi:hypothetical protein [uncultured Rubinisphaera sp.]|uniref:hypothetical protein n=1 Tax=uncultured Rubinisphaera sp. TaxID=1678686 RepID=UPI0030DC636C